MVAKSATQYRGDGGYNSTPPGAPSTWKLSCVKPPGAYCPSEETRDGEQESWPSKAGLAVSLPINAQQSVGRTVWQGGPVCLTC